MGELCLQPSRPTIYKMLKYALNKLFTKLLYFAKAPLNGDRFVGGYIYTRMKINLYMVFKFNLAKLSKIPSLKHIVSFIYKLYHKFLQTILDSAWVILRNY